MVDDSFAYIICYLCPQIKIDDLFNAVGACEECNVPPLHNLHYDGGRRILEILKFVENDRLIEIEAVPGTFIENNTTMLAVPEVHDVEDLQRMAIRSMQISLRGDNVRMVFISIYQPILNASLKND